MSSVSSDVFRQKFEALPEDAKRAVADFIDFLFHKHHSARNKTDKQKLLEVSQWSNDDIKAVENAGKVIL